MKFLSHFLITFFILISSQVLSAFVLLSGPDEAILPVDAENPNIDFYWNGNAPTLKQVEEFEDGRWVGLSDSEIMEQMILLAFAKWNEVPASYVRLNLLKNADIDLDTEDKINSIVIKHEANITTAAFALPIIEDKIITDCDISVSNKPTSVKSLAYTITHEVGHCLGLGHAHSNYGAIMGYSRVQKQIKLGADDIAGLIYLYTDPDYSSPRKEFLACATIGSDSEKKYSGLVLVFLLLTPALVLLRTQKT